MLKHSNLYLTKSGSENTIFTAFELSYLMVWELCSTIASFKKRIHAALPCLVWTLFESWFPKCNKVLQSVKWFLFWLQYILKLLCKKIYFLFFKAVMMPSNTSSGKVFIYKSKMSFICFFNSLVNILAFYKSFQCNWRASDCGRYMLKVYCGVIGKPQ